MDVQWDEPDPETGGRHTIRAERFAGRWTFKTKVGRRGDWADGFEPTRDVWTTLLELLERRYQRRQGVDDRDVDQVKQILAALPKTPTSA